jgi:DNA-binding response OmpR family regulator
VGKRSLLLVDGDARSLRVLEVSLRKAGFLVSTAATGREALGKARTAHPDLIISDTEMPEMDGFELCREVKADPELSRVPFVFLTGQGGIENKIRGLELGVDEYLTKPIYIKEILTRIRILLQKKQRTSLETRRDPNTRFAGTLHDMGVVDLIQTIEVGRKSGLIHFTADGHQATIYFRNGAVIDAEAGHLQGAEAVYRLLTWGEGEFELLFRTVRRKDAIETPTPALLMEGMRRLDEWGRLLEQLPPLKTRFEVDVGELAERLADLPDELNRILRLFDGRRSLLDVIDLAGVADLECVELVSRLFFEGLLHEVEGPSENTGEVSAELQLEGWLSRQIPATGPLSALELAPDETPAAVAAEWEAEALDGAAEALWPSASSAHELAIDAEEPPTPPSGVAVAHVLAGANGQDDGHAGNGAALGRLHLVRRVLPSQITEVVASGVTRPDEGALDAGAFADAREASAPNGSALASGSDPLRSDPDARVDAGGGHAVAAPAGAIAADDAAGLDATIADADAAAAVAVAAAANADIDATSGADLDSAVEQDTDPELSETLGEELGVLRVQLASNGLGADLDAGEHPPGSNGVSRRHDEAGSDRRADSDASASGDDAPDAEDETPQLGTVRPGSSHPAAAAGAPASLDAIIEAESGPGEIADFDTSDLTPTPLPAPVPLGDERMNMRVKSSLGAEVATVSGELAELTPPRADARDIRGMAPRRAEQISAVHAPPGSASQRGASAHSDGSGNGRLRSVELDHELSAAAEIIEFTPARLRAVHPPPLRAETMPAPSEERSTRGTEMRSARISSMVRATAGRAFARTFTVTVAGAMLVGALFGLLFWWLGGPEEVAESATPAASIEDERTPIAAGSGDLPAAAALPVEPAAEAKEIAVSAPVEEPVEAPSAAVAADPLAVAAPPATYDQLYVEAKRARRHGDYDAVLDFAVRALEQRQTAQAFALQAEALLALGEPARALPAAQSAVALRPRHAHAWYIKGRIHRSLGQSDLAREAFEEYLELEPDGRRSDQVIDYIQDM